MKTTLLHKFAIAAASVLFIIPSAWAYRCERPKITDHDYDIVDCLFEDLARVKQGNQWGFIDKASAIVIPLQDYTHVSIFSERLASVQKDGKYGFIDKTGKKSH